jgi:ribonuclease HI
MNQDPLIAELSDIQRQIAKLSARANEIKDLLAEQHKASSPAPTLSTGAVTVYTDGACSGNPGPAGSGVVIMQGGKTVHEISESLGEATNNIAELTAIKLALEYLIDHKDTEVTLFTDSNYCIGVLTKSWKAKANVELVADIKELLKSFTKLSMLHVKGHSGEIGNERADELAVRGVNN